MLKLGILDQMLVREGGTPGEAMAEAVDLAQLADELGYHRYWIAEQHALTGAAVTAPELMVVRICAATRNLRVGAGGVLLSNRSPLVVAEQWRQLSAMYPGRIDLGIGRNTGTRGATHEALLYGSPFGKDHFEDKVVDLLAFLRGEPSRNPAWRDVRVLPITEDLPEIWGLGSGGESAAIAGRHGMAFCHAHFIHPFHVARPMDAYRKAFRPGPSPTPHAALGVSVLCADTEAEAEKLLASRDLHALHLFHGKDPLFPSWDQARAHTHSPIDAETVRDLRRKVIWGTPEQVRARLFALAEETRAREIIVQTMTYDFAARRRSYELLASAFRRSGSLS